MGRRHCLSKGTWGAKDHHAVYEGVNVAAIYCFVVTIGTLVMLARIAGAKMCGLVVQNSRLIARIDSCMHISKDVSMRARWSAFQVKAVAGIQCAAISTEIQKHLGRIFATSSQGCLPPVSASFYCLPHAPIDNDLRFLWIRITSRVRGELRRSARASPH